MIFGVKNCIKFKIMIDYENDNKKQNHILSKLKRTI